MSEPILIVDDEEVLRDSLSEFFSQLGYAVESCASLAAARRLLANGSFALAILDLKLPDGSGLDLLGELRGPEAPLVLVITAFPEVQTAVRALKQGAFDYINKPFDLDEMQLVVERALETRQLRGRVNSFQQREKQRVERSWTRLIGVSPAMERIREEIKLVACSENTTALLLGESGVGKELVAEAIHYQSLRCEGPLLKVNCAALPATLLEDELFGHEKGAFTDAHSTRLGLFELAHRGTLFLDEIAEMNIELQAKLLRVLEDRTITRVGGQQPKAVDVRIVAATNRDLLERIDSKEFRQDLYYRLNVFPIRVAPLRERREDIPLLAKQFLAEFVARTPGAGTLFSAEALTLLSRQPWVGNVRELRNLVERTLLLHPGGVIGAADLELPTAQRQTAGTEAPATLAELEREHILTVYRQTGENKSKTAELLGINRLTLRRKLKEYLLEDQD